MSKAVESAVSFAAALVRKGEYLGKAINVAANYYHVPREEVQRGLSARSGRSQAGKKRPAKPPRTCDNGDGREAIWRATCSAGLGCQHSYYLCAACGQSLPAHDEGEWDRVRWSAYKPTKAESAK